MRKDNFIGGYMQNKLYKITNILLKIKSYFMIIVSIPIMIISIIYIFIGQDLINKNETTQVDSSNGISITCSSAFTGGIMKAFGIIFLIASILLLIIGLVYLITTRRMKKLEGVTLKPVITLFVFELVSFLFYLIIIIFGLINDFDLGVILPILFIIIQCSLTSYLLFKIINKEKKLNV